MLQAVDLCPSHAGGLVSLLLAAFEPVDGRIFLDSCEQTLMRKTWLILL
jgi:hypothetical protein